MAAPGSNFNFVPAMDTFSHTDFLSKGFVEFMLQSTSTDTYFRNDRECRWETQPLATDPSHGNPISEPLETVILSTQNF